MGTTLYDIKNCLGIAAEPADREVIIHHLSTDSRTIPPWGNTLFTALATPQRNGHSYLQHAIDNGAKALLVQQAVPPMAGITILQVPNTLVALQQIARCHRQQFNLPVIGITGSNGKTIVKEWLWQLLAPDFNICRSPRSYNSQLGVPLSVWQLHKAHTLGIFEAGISAPGEMELLQQIIQPTLGIFTNLGAAHDEGFSSRQAKLTEKWKLFGSTKQVICHTDDELIHAAAKSIGQRAISWGTRADAQYQITQQLIHNNTTEIGLQTPAENMAFTLPFTDAASVENALHALVACLQLGVPAATLQQRLPQLHALHMRLEWKKGVFGSLLLNDSYSYDLTSLEIALNHLQQQGQQGNMMAILSDLPGHADEAAYAAVAALLAQKNVHRLAGVGPNMQRYASLFAQAGIDITNYTNTANLLEQADRRMVANATVLIKGGRLFEFEKITAALEQQQHETVLEINLAAIAANLQAYRALLAPGTKIMVMLKAFGYGSTDAELGRWLQHNGVDYLAVAYADEGIALREGGVRLPIMVLNPEPGAFEQMVNHRLEPEIFSFDLLEAFEAFAAANGLQQYPIHLKLDTGMHRLGFLPHEADRLADALTGLPHLRVASVFTHLVASENPEHDAFTRQQASLFDGAANRLRQKLGYYFLLHAANTAGILRHPYLHYHMVRLGIGLFGTGATHGIALQPATRLHTTVAQVKQVNAGESVGYGRHALLSRNSTIATVRIGYADGYRRAMGNGTGSMWLHGRAVPVVGNVCMDMTMLDVTDLPSVKPGDRVEVFGDHISVNELARLCNTIPYEIMTGISRRVKRVLVEE